MPDNITPPLAACLGDLLTLFILALLGTALVGAMDTPFPLIAVILMSIAAGWFTKRVMRNQWVKKVARGGWVPLVGVAAVSLVSLNIPISAPRRLSNISDPPNQVASRE